MLFLLLSVLLWMSWLVVPMLGSEIGSPSIPQVIVYNHPSLGPGLFYPEETARHNDAMVEALVQTKALYEQRFDDLYLLLEATEAKAQVAQDSLQEVPYLLNKAVMQAYKQGVNDGRIGIGFSGGWNFLGNEAYAGVGFNYNVWTWNSRR